MHRKIEESYENLKSLIEERQAFEAANPIPPYSTHPTTIDFLNTREKSLLQMAAALGDLEKVKECLEQGADVNLRGSDGGMAITAALTFGHLEVAKYLFEQGAHCRNVQLTDCEGEECQQWFLAELKKSFNQSFPSIEQDASSLNNTYLAPDNKFFSSAFSFSGGIPILNRLLELNEYELVQHANPLRHASDIDVLMTAISSRYNAIIPRVLDVTKEVDSKSLFTFQPLHEAIKVGNIELVEKLLEKGANINALGTMKLTPLLMACFLGNESLVTSLLEKGADPTLKSVEGNSALHLAAGSANSEIMTTLLNDPRLTALKYDRNIYGKTAFDSTENDISQSLIIDNITYYLRINYRDTDYLESEGYCNGLSFLFQLYSGMGKQDYFFATLALLATWDKDVTTLKKPFASDLPQAKFYKNLDELFEQWINDATLFQSLRVRPALKFGISQNQRKEQYRIVGREKPYEPVPIYVESGFSKNALASYRSREQLKEMFTWFLKMPNGMKFDIGGGQHAVACYLDEDGKFNFYDPNLSHKVAHLNTLDEFLNVLIDCKYIMIRKFAQDMTFSSKLGIFYFAKDRALIDFEKFEIFKESDLPKNKDDAALFQQNSPNGLTHLHVAVMTHSLASIRRLLNDGFCDLGAINSMRLTALDLAMMPGFYQQDILDIFLNSNQPLNFQLLFDKAVDDKQDDLAIRLLNEGRVEIDELSMSSIIYKYEAYHLFIIPQMDVKRRDCFGSTFLHYAARNHDPDFFIKMVSYGADPNVENAENESVIDVIMSRLYTGNVGMKGRKYECATAILPMLNNKELIKSLIAFANQLPSETKAEDVFFIPLLEKCKNNSALLNARDINGVVVLFHAVMCENVAAVETLLKIGCDVNTLTVPAANNILIGLLKNTNYPAESRIQIINLLLDYKINLQHVNAAGETAFSLLEKEENASIKTLFTKRGLLQPDQSPPRI